MSVKSIFKILALSLALPVILFIMIELYNVTLSSASLNKMVRLAVNKSCEFFTQETYKEYDHDGKAMATSVSDIKAADGSSYISGDFYGSNDAWVIWHRIYGGGEFSNWCNSMRNGSSLEGYSGYPWQALESLVLSTDSSFSPGEAPDWDASDEEMLRYSIESQAETFRENMYTPINLGIPYLDKDITNRIFQWNLASLLSNCDSDLVQTDENGKKFVNYKGFACYCDAAKITNYTYTVYDISTTDGRIGLRDAIGYNASEVGSDLVSGDERDRICVVSIEYEIPVRYIGITKRFGRIFNFAWDTEVSGYDWGTGNKSVHAKEEDIQHYSESTQTGYGGGQYDAINNTVPVAGKLNYAIVK